MNCSEAEVFVSALYDGEQIPSGIAHHIASCDLCHRTLNDYSLMGVGLRLSATLESAQLPPLKLPAQRSRFDFLWRRVALPRWALAALIACIVLATVTTSLLRAQPRSLWFQFGYGLNPKSAPLNYSVARGGYDDTQCMLESFNGSQVAAALRIKVESISPGDVVLRCRAVPARVKATETGFTLLGGPEGGISLAGVAPVHYKPGESLAIPIEGGGTIFLAGDVMDHQPKIAFGIPLEPAAGKIIVRSPVLAAPDKLVGEINGASATANADSEGVNFRTADGVFTFALRPFSGAIEGKAEWGEITFQLDGTDYRLVAAAPITGGDQPRPVWVRHDPQSDWAAGCGSACIGTAPLPK